MLTERRCRNINLRKNKKAEDIHARYSSFKPGEDKKEGHNYSIRHPDVTPCSVCPNDV